MATNKEIYDFAAKWCSKFNEETAESYFERYMGDDCHALCFEMDCGHAFSEKYGDAFGNSEALEKVIGNIDDIPLLGAAVFSKWRGITHWGEGGLTSPENRKWFLLILERLMILTENK